jgi:hypothetical protein
VSHPSSLRVLALHGVRLKGLAEPASVAALWDLDEAEVAAELKGLAAVGLVQRRDGRVAGWQLTPEGRAEDSAQLAAELDAAGVRDAVEDAYHRFLGLNPKLLAACTAWQLKSGDSGHRVNDHTDRVYDASVIGQLRSVHGEAGPALGELAAALERFARYPVRLDHALAKVQVGATEWFTKPLLDSYHTIWFELHEDLLSTLGLERGSEGR